MPVGKVGDMGAEAMEPQASKQNNAYKIQKKKLQMVSLKIIYQKITVREKNLSKNTPLATAVDLYLAHSVSMLGILDMTIRKVYVPSM